MYLVQRGWDPTEATEKYMLCLEHLYYHWMFFLFNYKEDKSQFRRPGAHPPFSYVHGN
jgi:hypothetical protein